MWVIISRARLNLCPNQEEGLRDAVRSSSKMMAKSLMYQLFDHAFKRLICEARCLPAEMPEGDVRRPLDQCSCIHHRLMTPLTSFIHADILQEQIESHKLPLTLLGSSYHGVSVNDCIHNALNVKLPPL